MIDQKEKRTLGQVEVLALTPSVEEHQSPAQRNFMLESLSGSWHVRRFEKHMQAACAELQLHPNPQVELTNITHEMIDISSHEHINNVNITFRLNQLLTPETLDQLRELMKVLGSRNTGDDEIELSQGFTQPNLHEAHSTYNPFHRIRTLSYQLKTARQEVVLADPKASRHQKNLLDLALHISETKPVTGARNFILKSIRQRLLGQNLLETDSNLEVTLHLQSNTFSEAEVGYLVAQLYLILQQDPDVKYTHDYNDRDIRKTLFLHTYSHLLSDRFKAVTDTEISGLEAELAIIEIQTILPLIHGHSEAQSVGLVGPPGTGKTLIVRRLITKYAKELAFIPLKPDDFGKLDDDGDHTFERILANIDELSDEYGFPYVLVQDDAENLFKSNVNQEESANTVSRSRILQILNGLGDSQIRFILTFNEPQVLDAAARRRLLLTIFRLPTNAQRADILKTVIDPTFFIDQNDQDTVIHTLVQMTDGFNSSYLAKINEVALNLYLSLSLSGVEDIALSQLLIHAVQIVKESADLEGLQESERVALSFGQSKKPLGFLS